MTKKEILKLIELNKSDFSIFNIPKKSGGLRRIFALNENAKSKYVPLIKELDMLEAHEDAVAYRVGKTIKSTVEKHRNFNHHVKFDFSDFFPSFTFEHVYPRFRNKLDGKTLALMFWTAYSRTATQQGHPTSPKVTNLMMKPFDAYLKNALLKRFKGEVAYSRYADDILISTNIKASAAGLEKLIQKVLKETKLDFLKLNSKKTAEMHHKGKVFFLGICISNNRDLTVGHKLRKQTISKLKAIEKRFKDQREVRFETAQLRDAINKAIYINSVVKNKINIEGFLNCLHGEFDGTWISGYKLLVKINDKDYDRLYLEWKRGAKWNISTDSNSANLNTK